MLEKSTAIYCAKCGLQLPLVLDETSEDAEQWACIQCGEACVGVFDTSAPDELWGNVRRRDVPPII
jgi:hypothetical protein